MRLICLLFLLGIVLLFPANVVAGETISKKMPLTIEGNSGNFENLPILVTDTIFTLMVGHSVSGNRLFAGCQVVNFTPKEVKIDYTVYFYDASGKEVVKGTLAEVIVYPGMQIDKPQDLSIKATAEQVEQIKSLKIDLKIK